MIDAADSQSVIILTGMHRSGTSLTASLLQSAGINFGDRLMGEDLGNAKGHFEDLDFVEFHQNVLQSQGISVAGWTEQNKIQVQPQYLNPAKALISTRKDLPTWGWKDPRTTLFLDFWSRLIPDAKYLFVYRSPWEVLDSLFRRGDVIFRTNPNFAVTQWCNYNQAVLDFFQSHPEQSLLIDINSVIQSGDRFIELINQKFGLKLQSPESLYQESLFTSNIDYHRQALITKFFPEAVELYEQLQQQANFASPTIVEDAEGDSYAPWILQDWNDLRSSKSEKRQLETQLRQTHQQLQQREQELANSNTQLQQQEQELASCSSLLQQREQELSNFACQLQQKEQELADSNTQLQQKEQELADSNIQLQQKEQELADLDRQLESFQEETLHLLNKQQSIGQKEIEQFKKLVAAIESSKFWKIRQYWFGLKQKLNIKTIDTVYQDYLLSQTSSSDSTEIQPDLNLKRSPKDSTYQTLLKKLGKKTRSQLSYYSAVVADEPVKSKDFKYQQWLRKHYPKPENFEKIKSQVLRLDYQPLISIIVPVYNPDRNFLKQAIESVIEQIYPNWELCLADDRSSKPHVKSVLEEYAQKDERIKVVYRSQNGHISEASNSALEIASGEYIALLDHDDLLAPHALAEVVELLNRHPEADFIYTDEDKVNEQNVHQDPFFKPDWCPDSFLARMYTCHLGIYRRSLVTEVGNFRVGFEGSQDYDLVLRVTEKTDKIFHIPNVLYHWRIHSESTASESEAKPYAANAAQKAIGEAIARRGEPGKVATHPVFAGVYTVRYDIEDYKLVSIIIPTKDLADTLDVCLKSIFSKTTYPNYEVIVIDNGSTKAKTFKCFEYWQKKQPDRFKCYTYDVPFNYSQINNYAVKKAEGDYLLFLNNDTEVITPDWIEAMVEQAQRESIGAVGSLLLYPDDTVQHAGVVLGIGGVAGHSHKNFSATVPGYISQLISTNNYSAVTAACLMCRRDVFEEVGGFETKLAIAFNDVDLCLKIVTHGYRNIYLPHVVLYHYESKSRGYENTPEKQARFAKEINYMKQTWQQLCDNDPCYSPHLTKTHEDYSLNI